MWRVWICCLAEAEGLLAILWGVLAVSGAGVGAFEESWLPVRIFAYLLCTCSPFTPYLLRLTFRLLRTLPLSRAEIANSMWLACVILHPLYVVSALLAGNWAAALFNGASGFIIAPLVFPAIAIMLATCGLLIERALSQASLRHAFPWLPAVPAVFVAIVFIRNAPGQLDHLNGLTLAAFAIGAGLVALSFAMRHLFDEALDRTLLRTRKQGVPPAPGSLALRLVPARWRTPFPRLMFYWRSVWAPVTGLAIVSFVLPFMDGSAWKQSFAQWAVLFALCDIVRCPPQLPSLRAERQLPLSRFRLTLSRASHYMAYGVSFSLWLLLILRLGDMPSPHMAVVAFFVMAAAVLLGALSIVIGVRRKVDWRHLILLLCAAIFGAIIVSFKSAAGAGLTVFLAAPALAAGLALHYYAVARSSAAYRPAPPGERFDHEEA